MDLKINEIFRSIQGEGMDTGSPTTFVRFTGCNLRCSWCDTTYAYTKYDLMSPGEVVSNVVKYGIDNVCITGGEPLCQKKCLLQLITLLKNKNPNANISVETNGSKNITPLISLPVDVAIKMDYKLPSSNMNHKMFVENIGMLRKTDELKFVVGTEEDYAYAEHLIRTKCFNNIRYTIIIQPVYGSDIAKILPKKLIQSDFFRGNNIRFGGQLHKIFSFL